MGDSMLRHIILSLVIAFMLIALVLVSAPLTGVVGPTVAFWSMMVGLSLAVIATLMYPWYERMDYKARMARFAY